MSRLAPSAGQVQTVVSKVFGLQQLRPGQREVIDSVLAGRHTLAPPAS